MKAVAIAMIFVSFLYAQVDESQRIKSILQDITELRSEYDKCQNKLYKKTNSKISIEEFETLEEDVAKYKNLLNEEESSNETLKNKIDELNSALESSEKINDYNKKLLSDRDYEIESLRTHSTICDANKFPKLTSKDKIFKNMTIFKPSSFRFKIDSYVYNEPGGTEVAIWEKDRSFTSNAKTDGWIKITGFFVKKRWSKAKIEMWVEIENVIKR